MLDFNGPCHFLSLRNVLIRRVTCLEPETGMEGKQPYNDRDRDRDWSDVVQAKNVKDSWEPPEAWKRQGQSLSFCLQKE